MSLLWHPLAIHCIDFRHSSELLLELLRSDDGLPRNEEGLILKPAANDVLRLESPWNNRGV